ncbi:MAG: adenosylhomocysteinase [Halobacteriaceae archaeon]
MPEDPLKWARDHMPIHQLLMDETKDTQPFDKYTVAVASHLEHNTGVLIETLHNAGANVLFTPSEPESTNAEVITFLDQKKGITAYAQAEMTNEAFANAQHELLETGPDIILDDGGELISKAHQSHSSIVTDILGGVEQTTAGITRIEAMDNENVLQFPVYGANDAPMKHRFDNVHGTGESALTNITITTNALLAGKRVVIAGYGYVGRGIANKARSLGAKTIVTEVDPRRALEAHMDGHEIMPMVEAATEGEIFITATGTSNVIRKEHINAMNEGALLSNAGHFDVEIDIEALESLADTKSEPQEGITRYHFSDDKYLDLAANGRLVNLTGPYSKGHPGEVMDTTFALMFEAARELRNTDLDPGLYQVSDRVDRQIAELKLATLDTTIDEPTEEQQAYDANWRETDSGF